VKTIVRSFLILLFVLAVAVALGFAFWPQPLDVELGAVSRGVLIVTVDEDGQTRVKQRYVVTTPLAGRLLRIPWKPGDRLEATQDLAVIEPDEPTLLNPREVAQAQAKVRAAEAALERIGRTQERARLEWERAQKELKRVEDLAQRNVVPQSHLDDAEVAFRSREQDLRAAKFGEDVARFELEIAQAVLLRRRPTPDQPPENSRFVIRTPVPGRVLRVLQESETMVQPGTRLLELGDPDDAAQLEVEVDVLSTDAVKVRPGARAWLEQWGGDSRLSAHVRLVEPSGFTKVSALGVEEQRVWVVLDFDPGQKPAALADGFRVEARIVVWEQQDVLQVPTGALFRAGDDWAVFVAEGGRAQLRSIRLGQRNSLQAQVLEGLQVGTQVILHPSDKVRSGVAVRSRSVVGR
jgi:HlyD family secretion protein